MSDRIARLNAALGGRYTVERVLGEGGMAVVYLARQHEPVDRMVALKVLSPGEHSDALLERFEMERASLARMDHPSIATVFDAGVTSHGEPWFAMELVEGTRITDFCDEAGMTVEDRLELFIRLLHAVQHAHQKGVIHRDLKPSNVLVRDVDGVPQPRVIDFGIAKAVGSDGADGTDLTRAEQLIGTPAYMSPEQIEGLQDIDTRSDIFALGTLLYELLTGVLPFDRERYQGWAGVATTLRDDPPTLGRRFTTLDDARIEVARRRSTTPTALRKKLSGDLQWIVARALEKDREHRYETAHAFALDVRRYLEHEVVEARDADRGYRIRKFVRRNRPQVAVASVAVLGLAAFAVTASVQATRIAAARDEANARRDQAEELIDFMLSDLRSKLEPLGRLEVLDDVGDRALAYFASVPVEQHSDDELASRAQALHQLGQVRMSQGRHAEAEPLFRESLRLTEELSDRDPASDERLFDLGQSQFWVGALAFRTGDLPAVREAWERYRDISLELRRRDGESLQYLREVGYAHSNLGVVLSQEGDAEAAVREYEASLAIRQAISDVDPGPTTMADMAQGHFNLARGLVEVGRLSDAQTQFEAEMEIREELLTEEPANATYKARLLVTRNWLARVLTARGDVEDVLALRRQSEREAAALSAQDPSNATWSGELGLARAQLGRRLAQEGEPGGPEMAADAVELLTRLTEEDPDSFDRKLELLRVQRLSAEAALAAERYALAAAEAERAVATAEEIDHRLAGLDYGLASIVLGDAWTRLRHPPDSSAAAWRRANERLAPFVEDTRDWMYLSAAATALIRLGREEEARPLLDALRAQGVELGAAPRR